MLTVNYKDEEVPMAPKLQLITGGKGTTPPTGENWLSNLNKGTAFACKEKGNTKQIFIYIISFKHTKTVVLVNAIENNERFAVDPEDFCKRYSLFEILGIEDDSIRTVRSPELENDVDAEGRQPEHGEAGPTEV